MPPVQHPQPIVPNLGGPVDPASHVGHHAEYDAAQAALATGGCVLTGDRRMGKTSLLAKLEADLSAVGHVVVRVSGERSDPATFGDDLLHALRRQSALREELKRWHVKVDVGYGGIRIVRDPSRVPARGEPDTDDLLEWAARRVAGSGSRRLVVMIDEVSVLVGTLEQQATGRGAGLLHDLRRARQEIPGLAIVLSGSIGLHHVVTDATALNDIPKIRVGPLVRADAEELALRLLAGAEVEATDLAALASAMAEATDGIAFYLHHLANAARRLARPMEPEDAESLVTAALLDVDDPWNFGHYLARIKPYYGPAEPLALALLDLASDGAARSVDELNHLLGGIELDPRPTRDDVARATEELAADHYRAVLPDHLPPAYGFSSNLLRRAWRVRRHLP